MNRRSFLTRLGGALGLIVAAPVIAKELPCREAAGVLTFKGVPVVTMPYLRPGEVFIVGHPTVVAAYNDLVRSDQMFWKSQR